MDALMLRLHMPQVVNVSVDLFKTEAHKKRLTELRGCLDFIKESDWMYESSNDLSDKNRKVAYSLSE